MFFDPTFVLLIPAIVIALYAQHRVRSTYKEFQNVYARSGLTGAQAARKILDKNGMQDVAVEEVAGELSDHYDPRAKIVRLSSGVYNGTNLSALGVAAHETGHALQDSVSYVPLKFRTAIFPVANIGTMAAFPLFLIGLLFSLPPLMDLGILFFVAALVFQLVTLPVEYNASNRAFGLLTNAGVFTPEEIPAARKVLRAAGLTYVAAATMSLLQLIRLLILRQQRD